MSSIKKKLHDIDKRIDNYKFIDMRLKNLYLEKMDLMHELYNETKSEKVALDILTSYATVKKYCNYSEKIAINKFISFFKRILGK